MNKSQLKEETKKLMNALITKFNILRNIKDENWSNKLLDVIKLTTTSILMLISKCNANHKEKIS